MDPIERLYASGLKVGDVVRVTSHWTSAGYELGHEGEVLEIDWTDGTFRVGPRLRVNWMGLSQVEVISNGKHEAPTQ